jgi:hypothetical protein
MSTKTCQDCSQPLEFAYDRAGGRWIPLDAQVVDGDAHPAVWLVRRGPGKPTAVRPVDLAAELSRAKGISEQAALDRVLDAYEAHFDHRETCPARQHRQERKRS